MTQLPLPSRVYSPADPDPLGVPAYDTHEALQTDVFKELVNKLAWALGSTYRLPYANNRTDVRHLARRMASQMIIDHGYPSHIARG